ncbi:MAG: clostripain-related cysteine peptidase [Myxococcota bacterium]
MAQLARVRSWFAFAVALVAMFAACGDGTSSGGACDPACASGFQCIADTCVPVIVGGCDAGCGSGTECIAGQCVQIQAPVECVPACASGRTCVNGGCVSDAVAGGKGHTSTPGSSWTVLVYLVADNDLEPAALVDLEEMMAVGDSAGFRFVVQVDRSPDYTSEGVGNLANWDSAKRLVVKSGSFEEIADLGEIDTTDPAVLADFIDWGLTTYPADRTMLILWDHGGGWEGFGVDETTAGKPLLKLNTIRKGISQGLADADKERFDIIGFDACLMANAETALVLAPYGEYLLASEETEPGHGWDYRSFAAAKTDSSIDPVSLAKSVLSGFFAQAAAEATDKDLTLSIIDLTLIGELGSAMNAMATALTGAVVSSSPRIGKSREEATRFGKAPDPQQETNLVDFGDFARRLAAAEGASFAAAKKQLDDALARVVVQTRNGPASGGATGLTIYFPPFSKFYNASYDAIPEAAPWRVFLNAYYTGGASITQPMDIGGAANEGFVSWVDGEATIEVPIGAEAAAALVSAEAWVGLVDSDDGSVYLLATFPADFTGSSLTASWAGEAVFLSQGTGGSIGYVEVEADDESGLLVVNVPFAYVDSPGSQDVGYVIRREFLDPQTLQSYGYLYYEIGDSSTSELYPVPGSSLVPIIPVARETGTEWTTTADAPFDATAEIGLTFISVFEDLEPGTLVYLEIDAYDYGGNLDYVSGLLTF